MADQISEIRDSFKAKVSKLLPLSLSKSVLGALQDGGHAETVVSLVREL